MAGDPAPVVLHVAPVVDRWDGGRTSWADQPRRSKIGLPETRVSAESGARVRLDVRALVERWRRRGEGELSLAVLADGGGASGARGIAFALAPGVARGPELELYLR